MPRSGPRLALALTVALATMTIAAGCLGNTDPAGEPTDDPPTGNGTERAPAEAPSFTDPLPVARTGVAEPHALVAPNGTRYVLDFAELYRADGQGSYEPAPNPFDDRGDSDLAVDEAGRLHYIGMGIGDEGPQLPYHVRNAEGEWQPVRELAPEAISVDRPWMILGEDGLVVVTYNDFETGVNRVRVSQDGGATWEDTVDLPSPFAPRVGPPLAHGDTIVQPWRTGGEVTFALSSDEGRSWTTVSGPGIPDQPVGSPRAAMDEAGTLYLALASGPADGGRAEPVVRVWHSPDLGDSWSDPVRVDGLAPSPLGEDPTAIFPWIVAGDPGHVAVAFYEDATGTTPGSPAGVWYPAVSVSTTADRAESEWVGLHLTDAPVKNGSMCTRGAGCQTEDWRFRDYFTMHLSPEGHPFVAFVRDTAPASPTNSSTAVAPIPVEVVAVRAMDGWTGTS